MRSFLIVSLLGATTCFGQASVQSYQPFTANLVTTYFDDSDSSTEFRSVFARKSNGSYARFEHTEDFNRERGTSQYIADFDERTWTTIKSYTRSATVLAMDEQEFGNFRELPFTCRNLEDQSTWKQTGKFEMLGFEVIEIERNVSARSRERLSVAPVLNCFPLRELLVESDRVVTKVEATEIQRGDPPAALFAIPVEYALVSPGEFEKRWKQLYNGRDYLGERRAADMENRYQRFMRTPAGQKLQTR